MIRVTSKQFWMDNKLKVELDTICYNLPKDWDAVLIISGDGKTRTGKTHIASQIGFYCAEKLGTPFNQENNIVFSGETLRNRGHERYKAGYPKSVIIYDEAREGLDAKKIMQSVVQDVLDYLAECGMYNHLLIIVLPDFFELPKSVAINRSIGLINVVSYNELRTDKEGNKVYSWERGRWEYFNQKDKKKLYINGKKYYDYEAGLRTSYGDFRECWVIDKEAYEKRKLDFLIRNRKSDKDLRFAYALKALCNFISQKEAAKLLNSYGLKISNVRICQMISEIGQKGV